MSDLAAMLYGTANNAEQGQGQGLTQSIQAGADLALKKEQLDNSQQMLAVKMQELQQAKLSKYIDMQEVHAKMPDGPAKIIFGSKVIPNVTTSMGLDNLVHPVAQDMLVKDSVLAAQVISDVRNGKVPPAIFGDPVQLAKYSKAALQNASAEDIQGLTANYGPEIQKAYDEYKKGQESFAAANARAQSPASADKQLADFGKTIANPSSRSDMGQSKQMLNAADSIKQLTDPLVPKNATREQRVAAYNNLTSQQNTEVIRSMDRLLSRSNPTVHGQENLTPGTWSDLASKYGQKVVNAPIGAQQGEFIENMMGTVNRERKMNADKFRGSTKALKSGLTNAEAKYSDKMDKMVEEVLKEPSTGNDSGAAMVTFSGRQVSADKLRAYINDPAHANNPDLPAAKAALGGQ